MVSIVVGVLEAGLNRSSQIGQTLLGWKLLGYPREIQDPIMARLDAELLSRREGIGVIERAQ